MLIDEDNIKVQYDSTSASQLKAGDTLPFPFNITEETTLKAVLTDGTQLVYKRDYTVNRQSTKQVSVTLNINIPVGSSITLYRETPLDQVSEFPQEAKFNSRKIEDALDKLTMQNQEQREALSRALKLPLSAPIDISNLALPNPEPNRSVKWNSSGTALINTSYDPDTALVQTEQYRTQAQQSAAAAKTSQNAAKTSETNAKTSATTATQKADQVESIYEEAVPELTNIINNGIMSLSTASNALRDTQISQYISKIPQRSNYTLSDGIAIINPGHVWIVPYGTTDQRSKFPVGSTFLRPELTVVKTQFTNNKFFVWVTSTKSYTINYNASTARAGITLRCVGSTGASSVIDYNCVDSDTQPSSVGIASTLWYDTKSNFVKYSMQTSTELTPTCSLPIWVQYKKDIGVVEVESNDVMGCMGNLVYTNADVELKIGRSVNSDGTRVQSTVKTYLAFATRLTSEGVRYLVSTGGATGTFALGEGSFGVLQQYHNTSLTRIWDPAKNVYQMQDGSNLKWRDTAFVKLGKFLADSTGRVIKMVPDTTLDLAHKVDLASHNIRGGQAAGYYVQNDFLDAGVAPPCNLEARWYQKDKKGSITGGLYTAKLGTTGEARTALYARNDITGENKSAQAMLSVTPTGDFRFSFPRCTTVPTTASTAAADKVAVVVSNYRNGRNFYYKRSDGFIHQGGTFTVPIIAANKTWATTLTTLIGFATTEFHVRLAPLQDNGNSFHLRYNYAHPASKNTISCLFSSTVALSGEALWYWEAFGY